MSNTLKRTRKRTQIKHGLLPKITYTRTKVNANILLAKGTSNVRNEMACSIIKHSIR